MGQCDRCSRDRVEMMGVSCVWGIACELCHFIFKAVFVARAIILFFSEGFYGGEAVFQSPTGSGRVESVPRPPNSGVQNVPTASVLCPPAGPLWLASSLVQGTHRHPPWSC